MKTDTLTDSPAFSTKTEEIRGADLLVRCLEQQGVEVVFAYPGGASMEIHQALTRPTPIRTILPRHEQGCGFMAHGYARATGKPGVCMATSGPGATNLVTCIADAYMDSIPLIAITGQVKQHLIGKSAFQETDVYGMTLPIVKHSYLVLDLADLPRIIKEAFYLSTTGRPGPIVIDLPKDVQQDTISVDLDPEMDLPGYKPNPQASDNQLLEVLRLIEKAERPILYTGGGIISGNAHDELLKFAERTGLPVATTLMGLGGFPEDHPQSLRWFGMHGTVAGNWAVLESDLLIAMGARFDDRITGAVEKFAPDATIVHFDIDKSEHNKNKLVKYPIHTDIKYALGRMIELSEDHGFEKPEISPWMKKVRGWNEENPFKYEDSPYIQQQHAIEVLYEETKGEAIVTTGVGQHQMWAAQFYKFHNPRSYLSSLGLGTMGFGLPSALGAKVACPDRIVVDIDGDGSFQMNIQELATIVREKIPVKILLLDNQHLGMVVQWEDTLYDGVRAQTILSDPDNIGSPENPDGVYPDYEKICAGYGIPCKRIIAKEDLRPAIREMVSSDGPYLLHVVVPFTEHVMPFIPAGASAKDIITEKPNR